ncbi:MAG TPA: UbiD family decarboxylase [Thermodesulfobacteriota bacterium]|nr:UbiD family decarboxylase [Thermodesulfobacteriota bacterium]
MPFKDLRGFLARLEKEGELKRIEEEVDWNLEAGAMTRRALEENLPAPFFQKIKGCPKGYQMVSCLLTNHKRIAIAMDMAPDTPARELIEQYLRRKDKPIKPVRVKEAPCKENVLKGDKANLLKFPVPMLHEGDGGRYLGTWHITISKGLGGDWINWGMYRHMLHDRKSFGILAPPPKHFASMMGKIPNRPMEVAVAIGTEPISSFCAATPMPYGVSEVDVAGGLRGEPIELVQCETVDLTVPATAEIVIEGEIRPGEMKDEGPFGEYTGYRSEERRPRPVVRVKAITHRNNPIFAMSCPGIPVDDSAAAFSVCKSAAFLDELRGKGLPVTGAYVIPEGASHTIVVSTQVPYYGIAGEIAQVVWGARHGSITPVVIVVEDDVDPCNLRQVFHAMMTKCHPARGINKVEHALAWPLIPWLNSYEREYRIGARVYFDCTWPVDWKQSEKPKKMSFAEAYPEAIKKKALAKWRKYGY